MKSASTVSAPPGLGSPTQPGGHFLRWRELLWSRPEVVHWLIYILIALLVFLATARRLGGA